MGLLPSTYMQKSRIFLVPLIGIRYNSKFKMGNSYIESADLFNREYPNGISRYDKILIVTFPKEYYLNSMDSSWEKYESENLLSNRYFLGIHESSRDFIYTFDMEKWSHEWDCFVEGRYSYFTDKAKLVITDKYIKGNVFNDAQKRIFCYLYPHKEECIEQFAKELGYTPDVLKRNVKELCSKPDFNREIYYQEVKSIDYDKNQSEEVVT